MATTRSTSPPSDIDYPTSDGRPMGETEVHRDDMISLIQALQHHFADDPMVCVSGNLLLHYVPGDKRRHLSPDVFVVRGVPKRERKYYLVWEEGRAPDLVIELTSKSTKREDLDKKFKIYRDILRVGEYVLFDPYEEYLTPSLQGYRLVEGQYVAIAPEAGRLPSAVLGLHFERRGSELRLYDPRTGRLLPTNQEIAAALQQTEAVLRQTEAALRQSEQARRAEAEELERLRRELERLKRQAPDTP